MASVLIVTTAYSPHHTPLTQDLAKAMAGAGHEVTIAAIDWAGAPGRPTRLYSEGDVRIVLASPSGRGAGRWLGSSLKLRRAIRRLGRFDRLIAFAPMAALWAITLPARRRILYVGDHFPYHNAQIGRLPPLLIRPLAWLEGRLRRRFDTVAVMSPANRAYLLSHYTLPRNQAVEVVPHWGSRPERLPDRAATRRRHDLPADRRTAIFGGTLGPGRGVSEIVEAARIAASSDPDLLFLLVGEGALAGLASSYVAGGGDNLRLLAPLPRLDYLALAAACDVGIVVTQPDVDVPTFPSKTVDYANCGLPIAAAVEAATDYGDFVHRWGLGVAVEAGRADRLLHAIRTAERRKDVDPDLFSPARAVETLSTL